MIAHRLYLSQILCFVDLRALNCFSYNFSRKEVRREWVYAKNLEFFHVMLLHSSVDMETHF